MYTSLTLQGIEYAGDGTVRIRLLANGIPWGRGEYLDNYDQPLVWLNASDQLVVDDLTLILRPVTLNWAGGRADMDRFFAFF